jgi:hypothetical protein
LPVATAPSIGRKDKSAKFLHSRHLLFVVTKHYFLYWIKKFADQGVELHKKPAEQEANGIINNILLPTSQQ